MFWLKRHLEFPRVRMLSKPRRRREPRQHTGTDDVNGGVTGIAMLFGNPPMGTLSDVRAQPAEPVLLLREMPDSGIPHWEYRG